MTDGREAMVWLNGELLPARLARIAPDDRGFTLGDGLFETILVLAGVPQHAGLHLARLRLGAARLGIEIPVDDPVLLQACEAIIAANDLADTAVLRITVTRGAASRGIAPVVNSGPTVLITATQFTAPPREVTAIICRETRRNEFSPTAAIKSLNYLDSILARREARVKGAEDAILLNTQGDVAEATASTVFVLMDTQWRTPRICDGALPGIFRARALARQAVCEQRITEADLRAAQAICLGNSLGVRRIAKLDGLDLPTQATLFLA